VHLTGREARMTQVQSLLAGVLDVLRARPSALITDIDGTISPIVARPEDAAVTARNREAIAGLVGLLDVVGVVTAREEPVARNMLAVDGLVFVGNYGLVPAARESAEEADLGPVEAIARSLAIEIPGLEIEEKGVSFAVHYRNTPEPDDVRLMLLDRFMPTLDAAGARLLEGKRVVEVIPRYLPDKGQALDTLATRHDLRGIVYLGDDLSDVAVFREIARRRRDGIPGLGLAVVDSETPFDVANEADVTLAGVPAVEDLLTSLLRAVEEDQEWQRQSS
jgi:trehalose 6-phosphate phosphatase